MEISRVNLVTSKRMASIKGKDTKIELALRRKLWQEGLRYRIKTNLIGKPDITFPRQKLAIFVDGDFWHGHDWESLKKKLNSTFWIKKIEKNIQRDKDVNEALNATGWKVLRFWEHEINNELDRVYKTISSTLLELS